MLSLGRRLALLGAVAGLACRVEPAPVVEPAPAIAPTAQPAGTDGTPALAPLQVAVTVDDLPAHGPEVDGLNPLEIHRRLLAAFEAHDIDQVYGFINADKLEHTPELRAPLEAWVEAGHPLGNHTYRHSSLRETDLATYYRDIADNEPVLEALLPTGQRTPTFRYPYLLEGMSREDTAAIRDHLAERGYRIAPVTIDFYDWAFNAAFARCTALGDTRAVDAIRTAFIEHALEMLAWSDAAAQALYGRRIPHVLLLHVGAIDALLIEDLLEALEAAGVEWVPLDVALSDPAYDETYVQEGRTQGTHLDQKIDAEGGEYPPRHVHPRKLLDAMCLTPG